MNDKRRFPRVHFRKDYEVADRITRARVHWRNFEVSDIFDLSVGGFAASKPVDMEFMEDEALDFTLKLGELPAFSGKAKVAWVRDFSVGFSLLHLDPKGHLSLRRFLNDKLVGSHLRLMKKELYAKELNFELWYSAPNETHLFFNMAESQELPRKVDCAEVIIDGDRLTFDKGKIVQGAEIREKLIQILTHAPEDQVVFQTFLEQILEGS